MTRTTLRTVTGVALLAMLLGAAPPARAADDPAAKEAKAFYVDGMKQYNIGHYEEALKLFEKGYVAKPDAAFLFNLGQCYRMLHRPEEEIRAYSSYLRARPDAPNRADVEKFIADAESEVARRTNPAQPTGTMAPAPDAAADAARAATTPAPTSPEPATPVYKKWWLWTIVGVAVVGAGAGVGLGLGLNRGSDNTFPAVTF